MTPPDKPGRTEQAAEADRTAAVATSDPAQQDDQGAGGSHEGNGQKPPATAHVAGAEDLELSHGAPPPWQRVQPEKPTEPAAPPSHPTPPPGSGEKTVRVERPVVTGSAAANLFGGSDAKTINVPHHAPRMDTPPGGLPLGGRTAVNLDGTTGNPASTGPLRAVGAAAPSALRRPGRGPRRANLQIKRFDPWSVLKLSLVLGVALFFVWLVAVGILYAVLDGMGVWDGLNGISDELLQGSNNTGEPLISAGRVFGVAAIIGAVNIVLFSALATVGAFIYNVSADLAGGLEVTLAERE
ncbi:DUF3566 domain-containing protein [Actinophytocola oryzae]|uniref:Transmembrane protein DUF3566 n=1 Tax=Actinophytocola oryzae TaxID=502181 RepID=A0A4V3FTC6_9PSEU|nr:DUF3566 domain-containing protein [Actinophytocola oryzae]TDV50831.1 transmembrane protein DUF3566 [Actinophytocola oryzae]